MEQSQQSTVAMTLDLDWKWREMKFIDLLISLSAEEKKMQVALVACVEEHSYNDGNE